jgi:hypothetical protein
MANNYLQFSEVIVVSITNSRQTACGSTRRRAIRWQNAYDFVAQQKQAFNKR